MSKRMTARFPGTCALCGERFPAGTAIVFNGTASHDVCVEREAACLAEEDKDSAARWDESQRAWKAGECIRSSFDGKELLVTGAPSHDAAKEEARAVVASIRAAGGTARLVTWTRGGRTYISRDVVEYYGNSSLGHHTGYAFRLRVEQPE